MEALAITGVAVALPPLIDLATRRFRDARTLYQSYHRAEQSFKIDLFDQDIQSRQLEVCLSFVKDISPSLTEDTNVLFQKTLNHLVSSLEATIAVSERFIAPDGKFNKVRFSLWGRYSMQKCLQDVEKRQITFLRSVHFSVLFGNHLVDKCITDDRLRNSAALARVKRLREAISYRLDGTPEPPQMLMLEGERPTGLVSLLHPYGNIRIIQDPSSPLLVEFRSYEELDQKAMARVREIAVLLHCADPKSMSILQCRGFYPEPQFNRFRLVFNMPPESYRPRSLRNLLLAPENAQGTKHPLDHRLKLAVKLANAVLYVHSAKLVHKNIRPENILIFDARSAVNTFPNALGAPYLTGFEFARNEDANSTRTSDDDWEKNLYRHPSRQGPHLEVDFSILHDVYSLGVVLLELTLWRSLVTIDVGDDDRVSYLPNRAACGIVDRQTGHLKSPEVIRRAFVRRAEEVVPRVLGTRFKDVVVRCLECLDGGFGDENDLVDKDGVIVGLIYVQRVVEALEEISL